MTATIYALLAGLILIGLLVVARITRPANNKQGKQFDGVALPAPAGVDLTVATYNVQTGKNIHGQRDISRAAKVLQAADIAAVQEVYAAGWLNKLGMGVSQSLALAGPGEFRHLFAATRYRWFREQRGNLTLSKLPVTEWQIQMLPDQSRKSPRNMTICEFCWQGQRSIFINTHLHTGKGRLAQLQVVIDEFLNYPRAILAGDFNTKLDEPILQAALQRKDVTDAVAKAGLVQEGEDRIDWILTRGFDIVGGSELAKGVSDHPYFEVTLR